MITIEQRAAQLTVLHSHPFAAIPLEFSGFNAYLSQPHLLIPHSVRGSGLRRRPSIASRMQSRSVENEFRAFERVLDEQMPAVLRSSKSLHAAMGILPGTKMMDHQGETARRMRGAPALVTTSALPSNPNGATESGLRSAVLERDSGGERFEDDEIEVERAAEEDDDGEDENEAEDEAFNDSGFFEQVPTIMLQPPSPDPRIVGFGLEAVQSTRKRRTSEPLNWQPRQARKRLKTDTNVIDLTTSPHHLNSTRQVEDGLGQEEKGATE
ncbi:hypothetical protein LTR53_008282 [Teratosphaeriaceae sp. CCFEE 6253]|nr:hypothetical protein LTR53_008282 [Teratosphaeriaceae sp. CCFEE 6253]